MTRTVPAAFAAPFVLVAVVALTTFGSMGASAQSLERARESGTVLVGYRLDAKPLFYAGSDGAPAGIHDRIVQAHRRCDRRKGRPSGDAGICRGDDRRSFPGGRRRSGRPALRRRHHDAGAQGDRLVLGPHLRHGNQRCPVTDAPRHLLDVLAGKPAQVPARAAVLQAMRHKTFGVRSGTTAEAWLEKYVAGFGGTAEIVTVDDHAAGIAGVASGAFDAYFADRALLLGQVQETENPDAFVLSDRLFTFEPYAIGMPRGDEDLRLIADRTLSHFFGSPEFMALFNEYFGAPDERQKLLLAIGTLPD